MVLPKSELVRLLREQADIIEADDSYEGSLSYTFASGKPNHFEVEAALRIGNSNGQGGMRIV